MSLVKNPEEIELLRENNQLVSKTLAELGKHIVPGMTGLKLDKIAEEFIRSHGAEPSFLGFHGYPNTLCVSINDVVIHGIPTKQEFCEGDVVSVDCGTYMKGYCGDSAYTFMVGQVAPEVRQLLQVTKECLELGAAQAIVGNRVGDISYAVQKHAESHGYGVVHELEGHGLGKTMHEPPGIPNYGRPGQGKKLQKGMVICIEPMITMGTRHILQERDGWTIRTRDGKPAAHFEYAIAIGEGRADILTTFAYIEQELNK